MQRLNCSEIFREIKRKTQEEQLIIKYERTRDLYPNWENQETDYLGKQIDYNFGWSRNQQKYGFIYKVIFENLYFESKGEELGVTDADIQSVFNKFIRRAEKLDSFNEINEFTSYLYGLALIVIEEENKEVEEHENKGILRKLLDNDSTLDLQLDEISKTRKKLRSLNNEMKDAKKKWDNREITGAQLDELRDKKDEAIQYYTGKLIHLNIKYKNTSESAKYRRRKLLRSCFHRRDLYEPDINAEPKIVPRNVSTLDFIIREYCKWFNNVKYPTEIAEASRKSRIEKKRAKRLESKSNRQIETERRTEILRAYMDSDLSISMIARETGISKSAVQRILSELRKK